MLQGAQQTAELLENTVLDVAAEARETCKPNVISQSATTSPARTSLLSAST